MAKVNYTEAAYLLIKWVFNNINALIYNSPAFINLFNFY